MRKLMKYALALMLLCGVSATAAAQTEKSSDEYYPSWFVGLQAGAQTTFTNLDNSRLITPQYAIQAGRWFAPQFGVRLHIMGFQQISGNPENYPQPGYKHQTYKFKGCTGDLDFLFNMSNIINPYRASQHWNWNLFAGFGVNYTWDYKEYNDLCQNYYVAWFQGDPCGSKHATFNGRLGTQLEYNINKHFAVNLEAQANYKNDIYNLKESNGCDWQVVALVGVTYRFGLPKKKAKPVVEEPAPAPAPAPKPVVKEQPKPAPAPKPVVKDEPLKETFFYQIRESDANKEATLNKIVDWCNKYPSKPITISGYADKGTGNARVNKRYAQQRADKVAKALQQKGIDASRMTVNSYGDTEQPYAENDQNRCVIVVGE